jgi:YHS domain-containing protein
MFAMKYAPRTRRWLSGVALLFAAGALVSCRMPGSQHHHALGSLEGQGTSTSVGGGCCRGSSEVAAAVDVDQNPPQHTEPKTPAAFKGDPYLLDTDPVTGAKLPAVDKLVIIEHEGRELRFASDENVASFRAEASKYLVAVDEKLIAQQLPFYPLKACVVSGEKLGDMGKPVDLIYRNRLVRFCCASCKPEFEKDVARYVAKLDAAVVEVQGKKYPGQRCVVSGEEFGGDMGDPSDHVIGNRMVRLCCSGCVKKLRKDPLKYLSMLETHKSSDDKPDDSESKPHKHGDH